MVVTGAKSEADARTAARKYARIIQKLDFPARFADFKIQNMVGSCDVKFPIRLEGLAYKRAASLRVRVRVRVWVRLRLRVRVRVRVCLEGLAY